MDETEDEKVVTEPEEASPPPLMVLSNGSVKDARGKFMPGIRPTTAIASSEQGRALAARRVEVAKQKARARMVDAYREHTGKPGGQASDAYGEIAGEFTRSALANAMDKPRDAVHAAKLALRLADMLPADERGQAPAVAIQINVSADVEARLRELTADG